MIALVRREYHAFQAAGARLPLSRAERRRLRSSTTWPRRCSTPSPSGHDRVDRAGRRALQRRFDAAEVDDDHRRTARRARASATSRARRRAAAARCLPMKPFPLTTMVLNVTNQCNLACTYCYEYGEDKIVDTENGKQAEVHERGDRARRASISCSRSRATPRSAHLTFFGGETLMNFPVLKSTIAYARAARRRARQGGRLQPDDQRDAAAPEIIEFLAENDVGVTDLDRRPAASMQDKFRVFHNGTGSYDVVAPKIKELLRGIARRPIGARVTLTSQNLDVTQDLPAPDRGDRLLGSRLRAGDDVAGSASTRSANEGFDTMLGAVPRARARVPRSALAGTSTTASRT